MELAKSSPTTVAATNRKVTRLFSAIGIGSGQHHVADVQVGSAEVAARNRLRPSAIADGRGRLPAEADRHGNQQKRKTQTTGVRKRNHTVD